MFELACSCITSASIKWRHAAYCSGHDHGTATVQYFLGRYRAKSANSGGRVVA